MADIYKMVNEFIVKRQKEIEGAIIGEICEIAKENGIRTEIILNEKAITQALLKSQKKKLCSKNIEVEVYNSGGFKRTKKVPCCPTCFYLIECGAYCPNCGQALDWEV